MILLWFCQQEYPQKFLEKFKSVFITLINSKYNKSVFLNKPNNNLGGKQVDPNYI